jgi:HK97 family phage prohead protease
MERTEVPFEIKADTEEKGIIRGLGAAFGGRPDDGGDIIRKGAFQKTLEKGGRNGTGVVMLSQHGRFDKNPIGVWTKLVETDRGLEVEGNLAIGDPAKAEGTQLANDTYVLVKQKALRGLSIGWDFARDNKGTIVPGSVEFDRKKDARIINEAELFEISPVTFPMNTRAKITGVKGIEDAKTERELEDILRESGLSKKAAQYVVKLARPSLRESEEKGSNDGVELLTKMINQFKTEIGGIRK